MQSLVIFFYLVALGFLMELFNMWVEGERVEAEVKELVKYLPKTQEELDQVLGTMPMDRNAIIRDEADKHADYLVWSNSNGSRLYENIPLKLNIKESDLKEGKR